MKLSSINYLVGKGISSVWKNKMMSFASFCIMLVSLLMVGLSVLASININKIISGIEGKNEVIVIVKDDSTDEVITALESSIKDIGNVDTVSFYSKEEAWKSMIENMSKEEQDLFQYAEGDNPLPDTYKVSVKDIEKMADTTNRMSTLEGVESVKASNEFADVLISIRNIFSVIALAVVVALIIVCLVIISNTTRTSVFARRKEINIMKYVGATNKFIKIPFQIEGTIVGLLAAVAAFILTMFVYKGVFNLFQGNYQLWSILGINSLYSFRTIFLPVAIAYLAAGAIIGAIGTTISTSKYVKV